MNANAQGDLLPLPLADLRLPAAGGAESWRVGWLDKDHPALAPLTEPASLYQSVLVYKHFPMVRDEKSEGRVLARLEDGQPLLAERSVGLGTTLLLGTGVHVDWTNLPLRPLFLPLFARLTFHLAGTEADRSQVLAGAPLTIPLGAGPSRSVELEVVRPTGEVVRSHAAAQGDRTMHYADTHEAGVYLLRILQGKQPRQIAVAVNVDPAESEPATLSREELQTRFGRQPVLYCATPDELPGMVRRLREGKSLWEWFLAAVLIGLVFEVFLANRAGGPAAQQTAPPPPAAHEEPDDAPRGEALIDVLSNA